MPTALVIEDNEASVTVLTNILERQDYTVLSTLHPDEAARYCREFNVDVIVADIVLRSAYSGTEIAMMLRQSCPDIPVLFVSGTSLEGWSDSDFANIERLLPGRVEFLMKPFTAKALVNTVVKLLHPEYSEVEIRSALEVAKKFRQAA